MRYIIFILITFFYISTVNAAPTIKVLCYHSFIGNKNQFSFSLKELNNHITYFKNDGYNFVSMSDIIKNNVHGEKNILISIDDGRRSVYSAYYNILNKFNIKPLLAIYPAAIGSNKYFMTWKQLKKLSADGCDIAAHGYRHKFINKKLFNSNKNAFLKEIFYSKKVLEKKLNRKINTFIYPYGVRSSFTINYIKKAGYKYAFTINHGSITMPIKKMPHLHELPRYMLTRGNQKKALPYISSTNKSFIAVKKSKPSIKNKRPLRNIPPRTSLKTVRKKTIKRKSEEKFTFDAKTGIYHSNKKSNFSNSSKKYINYNHDFDITRFTGSDNSKLKNEYIKESAINEFSDINYSNNNKKFSLKSNTTNKFSIEYNLFFKQNDKFYSSFMDHILLKIDKAIREMRLFFMELFS